jgi:pimeloyl-ACP methyl ester carboxylesterase
MDDVTLPVVLVHGAWHGAWCWAPLQAELDRMGIPSYAIDLPGHGASPEPFADLHGGAARVSEFVERLGRDVVLVGHSYGGAVITEAALHTAHVRHLVYLTAFVLDEGESMISVGILPESPPPKLDAARSRAGKDFLQLDPELAIPALYAHCTPEVQRAAVARLSLHPISSLVQPVTGAAWRTIPSTYVRCTDDQAIPLPHQDAMATRCTNVVSLDTDHSPFASMPSDTAAILANVRSQVRR